ncbi:putative gluconokinase [Lamellibrachia satsuma]|nr:putative gluconokinase [Lamellibrachia satsuma]
MRCPGISPMQMIITQDRWPWLLLLHEHIQSWRRRGEHAVLACSALKQMYRDALTHGAVGRQHKDVRDVATSSTSEDDCSSTAEEQHGDTTKTANPFSEPSRFTDVVFVYLRGSKDLLLSRLSQRRGHYMPAALLDSQLATLEEPPTDGRDLVVDIDDASSVQTILMKIKTHFKI